MAVDSNSLAGLQTIYERETAVLAPYAMHSVDCRGRRYDEPEHPYRGPYQRDRDRVVHSAAFRRLSGKMQVFTGDMGDYHRTRLTHTHEVASIARTLGRALRLNEDLIEALALLHDIGHPPFGHAGEEALDAKLREHGGFSHNRQALTIAQELEVRYQRFVGLNLTRDVLGGQAARCDKQWQEKKVPLEIQVVDVADSIAYNAHDVDDAVKIGLVTLDELSDISLIEQLVNQVGMRYGVLGSALLRKAVVHELIDIQVRDMLREAGRTLVAAAPRSADEAMRAGVRLGLSNELAEQKRALEQFLFHRVYRHQRLLTVRRAAQAKLEQMFDCLVDHIEWLPTKFQRRALRVGPHRGVADFLAGMTDRYCESQFTRITSARPVG